MLNKHLFKTQVLLAALAAAVIAPISLFAQQKAATRTIKDSDIYVHEEFLKPPFTRKEASEYLKEYIAAFGDSDMPRSYEVFAKDPEKYKRIGTRRLKTALSDLYNYIFDSTVPRNESGSHPVSSDLMEVTGATDAWFRSLYNKALDLNGPAALMDEAISKNSAAKYAQAAKEYKEKFDELNKFVKKGPDRLSAEALQKITEANRARRKEVYIAQRKQQMLEDEAAAKAALDEEMKKAKAASKK